MRLFCTLKKALPKHRLKLLWTASILQFLNQLSFWPRATSGLKSQFLLGTLLFPLPLEFSNFSKNCDFSNFSQFLLLRANLDISFFLLHTVTGLGLALTEHWNEADPPSLTVSVLGDTTTTGAEIDSPGSPLAPMSPFFPFLQTTPEQSLTLSLHVGPKKAMQTWITCKHDKDYTLTSLSECTYRGNQW